MAPPQNGKSHAVKISGSSLIDSVEAAPVYGAAADLIVANNQHGYKRKLQIIRWSFYEEKE